MRCISLRFIYLLYFTCDLANVTDVPPGYVDVDTCSAFKLRLEYIVIATGALTKPVSDNLPRNALQSGGEVAASWVALSST